LENDPILTIFFVGFFSQACGHFELPQKTVIDPIFRLEREFGWIKDMTKILENYPIDRKSMKNYRK
jgi:hypothetical protein